MNIGEILRLNGYAISRLPSAPWQEALVEKMAGQFEPLDDSAIREKAAENYKLLCAQTNPMLARWTVRDAIDRTVLRRAKAAAQGSFYGAGNTNPLGLLG
jgi:hypothetical protein